MSADPARLPGTNGSHGTNGKLAPVDLPVPHRSVPGAVAGGTAPDGPLLEAATRSLLLGVGEDPTRDGLLDTPARVSKSMAALTAGYRQDPREVVGDALFAVDYDELVLVRDIEFYSLCEHHLLPFFGKAHVGYVSRGRVVGLSKLPRLIDVFARRLQVQERLTKQIAESVQDLLDPIGVGVVIEASHLCMMMRGVEKQNSTMVTSSVLGVFREHLATREEFLSLVGRR
jgi:GTP cyclohydrolase IA